MTLTRRILMTAGCAALLAGALAAQKPTKPLGEPDTPLEPPAPTRSHYLPDRQRDQQLEQRSRAFQRFLETQEGDWVSTWNYATETPKAIYGTGLRVTDRPVETLAEARALARQVVEQHRELLGTSGCELREVVGAKAGGTWVFVYDQYWQGLQVIDGRADVRIHESGVVSMLGAQAFQIPAETQATPGMGLEAARLAAWQAFGLGDRVRSQAGGEPIEAHETGDDRVVLWGDVHARERTEVQLAWELHMDLGDGRMGRCYVDAFSGAALCFINDRHECWAGTCGHAGHGGNGALADGGTAGFTGGTHLMGCPTDCTADHLPALPTRRGSLGTGTQEIGAPEVLVTTEMGEGGANLTGTVQAWVNPGPAATSPAQLLPLANFRLDFSGVGTVFTDANGNFNLPTGLTTPVAVNAPIRGRHVASISNDAGTVVTLTGSVVPGSPATLTLLTAAASEFDLAHTNVYWAMDDVNEYLRGLLNPVPAQLTTLSQMSARVNINDNCNAFYSGNRINFFTSGGGCNNTAHAGVIYHEWGHGLDDAFGGISQVDGLSEAWGDILATFRAGIPEVGPGFITTGQPVRTALNTTQYLNNSCGTSVHCQGQSFMGFAWDVRTALQGSLGTQAGAAKAEEIVLASVVADATNQPDAVREVFILDDDDGNLLNGTPNYDVLVGAAIPRNLPYPERQFFSFNHTPLADSLDPLQGRLIEVQVTPLFGTTLDQVELVAGTSRGLTRRRMQPGSGPGLWRGITPYEVSPNEVEYWFEAQTLGGETARFPRNGGFRYTIGDVRQVFSEDFESGALGWTSQQIATQNDWQLGIPTGKSGSSFGVPWQDPSSAYGGLNAYGNDLGIGNFNGAYQPNVQNFLRSPSFSTLGEANLRLRFARWLTVEEGIYDQAEIRVNGQTIWSNPANGNLLDTGWSLQEINLPTAVNNRSSNNIEWWLTTDGGLNLGGWAIDDVEVFSLQQVPTPEVNLRLNQEHVARGGTATALVVAAPNTPSFLVYGDTTGPIPVPGVGSLQVGGNFGVLVLTTNNFGFATYSVPVPDIPVLQNRLVHLQAIAVNSTGDLTLTNPVLGLVE